MKFPVWTTILATSVTLSHAQTPSNYTILTTLALNVTAEPANMRMPLAQLLPQSAVLDQPIINLPPGATSPSGAFVAIMTDPDAYSYLHWLQPNLVITSPTNSSLMIGPNITINATGGSYVTPQPQADHIAHRYTILLFAQPKDFAIPANYSQINPPGFYTRLNFDVAAFASTSGLGNPLGATYFRVLNGTAAETSALASATTVYGDSPATMNGTIWPSATVAIPGVPSASLSQTASVSTATYTGEAATYAHRGIELFGMALGALAYL